MLWRLIDRVNAQQFRPGVNHIMFSTGGNNHSVVGLNLIGNPINPDIPIPCFKSKELVAVTMDFFANILTGLPRHEHQLNSLTCIKDLPKLFILFGRLFDIIYKAFYYRTLLPLQSFTARLMSLTIFSPGLLRVPVVCLIFHSSVVMMSYPPNIGH